MECSRDLSFSCAVPRKSYRRRRGNFTKAFSRCKAFVITSLLILLLFKTHSAEAYEDWTNLCPSKCKCTWVGGKKTGDCQGARFTIIPIGFSSKLQVLDLSSNPVSQLRKMEFEKLGLVNLHKVFLRSCQIEKIDRDAFRSLEIMIELDLTRNKLESLDMEAFESNKRLRELRLGENPLTKLHSVQFPELVHLKLLDLSHCQLSQLNENTFDKLCNLEQLDLTGNKFQYISEQVFKPLAKLKSLSLENNPWKCDCRLRSFRDWIIAQNLHVLLACAEPKLLENVQWSALNSTYFVCKPEIVELRFGDQVPEALVAYVDLGSNITLECLVSGDPTPEVKWVRNDQVLTASSWENGKTYLLHVSGEYERWVNLTILKSDVGDAGEYFCVGSNAGGVSEKKLTLIFQDAPSLIGKGVGPGFGGEHGPCPDHSWLWVLNGVLSSLVIVTLVFMSVCFCNLRRRMKTVRPHDTFN